MTLGVKQGRPFMAALLLCAAPVAARDLPLGFPADCTPGDGCVIQNHFDHDPGPGFDDFRCGPLGYDGHDGTDIRVPTHADMASVDVLAAAPGTVRGARDGMADIPQGTAGAPDVTGRECGNGVVITHGGGWETQYCHLARGSVTVAPGDRVALGAVLGTVGLSGQAQFPHVHFEVRRDGVSLDPFDPDGAITCESPDTGTLWTDPAPYIPGGLLASGFAGAAPDYDTVKAGAPVPKPARTAPALLLWTFGFGSRPGDVIEMAFDGPSGESFATEILLERAQAQFFRYAGRRAPRGGWPEGTYTATIRHLRGGTVLSEDRLSVTLD